MNYTLPAVTIVFMILSCLAGFGIPVFLFFYFRKKKRADILPFFIGCVMFLVFALLLEAGVHGLILSSAFGQKIQNNTWLFALYGGLMAGLFEETARLTAFSTVLNKKIGKDANALMYGAGHGGFEAAYLLGVGMVSNIAVAVLSNMGKLSLITDTMPPEAVAQLQSGIETLASTAPHLFLIGILERVFAVTLHIALSVLVWFAVKNKRCRLLYPAAILIHCIVDTVAVLLSGLGVHVLAVEAVVGVMTVLSVIAARAVWKKYHVPEAEPLPEAAEDVPADMEDRI
ncbi:MAG: YhfC family intramembrane metalloprotease [Clostridia bacterium]|nr:YhfC family intramembrane metalloprotease [Clostridia bacterium]